MTTFFGSAGNARLGYAVTSAGASGPITITISGTDETTGAVDSLATDGIERRSGDAWSQIGTNGSAVSNASLVNESETAQSIYNGSGFDLLSITATYSQLVDNAGFLQSNAFADLYLSDGTPGGTIKLAETTASYAEAATTGAGSVSVGASYQYVGSYDGVVLVEGTSSVQTYNSYVSVARPPHGIGHAGHAEFLAWTRTQPLSSDIRKPSRGDTENPSTSATVTPRLMPVRVSP